MPLSTALAATALSGALYGIAFPPLGWWPVAWVALVPFLVAVHESGALRAAGLGVVLGIVASYGVGMWMPSGVVTYYQQPLLVGLAVFLACALAQAAWQFAAFALAYRRIGPETAGAAGPLLAAAAWTAAELARAKPVFGNPWALLGYSQTPVPLVVQIADVSGVYGIGFTIALVNAALAGCWVALRRGADRRAAVRGLGIAGAVVALVLAYGAAAARRVAAGETARSTPVLAVQGNLDLGTQWRPEFYGQNLAAYTQLTLDAVSTHPAALVVWPENALTFFLEREPTYRQHLAAVLQRARAELVTGGPRLVAEHGDGGGDFRNVAFLVAPSGDVRGSYEKRTLLPFAEYFPLPRLDFLRRRFGKVRQFRPGNTLALLPTPVGAAGVMICNEAMDGLDAVERVRAGAQWLVTLTNDSWIGQRHYADIALTMARLRAVEVRRWLVRASTAGPSAVVDPMGRIVDHRVFGVAGWVRGDVVARDDLTIYARIGDGFAWGAALVAVLGVIAIGRRGRTGVRPSPQGRRATT